MVLDLIPERVGSGVDVEEVEWRFFRLQFFEDPRVHILLVDWRDEDVAFLALQHTAVQLLHLVLRFPREVLPHSQPNQPVPKHLGKEHRLLKVLHQLRVHDYLVADEVLKPILSVHFQRLIHEVRKGIPLPMCA
eukprot:CAMPEP_0202956200 /NCGR_PEP_ID=MMETSP1396-20130829/736_1 /ASSEMBLY_ACC=CAM_ASM_000872 /TAXON_ID= /ORGANISM="Pseudokeronopsis sp., Strain Brazil" /LENGTH=133 /DNA_ID=CAMNT_0049673117 /DNA_START=77 /DNA_END=475 /DNA_ORIENTATION=+